MYFSISSCSAFQGDKSSRRSSDFLFGHYIGFGPLDGNYFWSEHVESQSLFCGMGSKISGLSVSAVKRITATW